jgi:hypothetical protein
MRSCKGDDGEQSWSYDSKSGQVRSHSGLCLDDQGPRISACNTGKHQQWDYQVPTGRLKARHSTKCLASEATQDNGVDLDEFVDNNTPWAAANNRQSYPKLRTCQKDGWDTYNQRWFIHPASNLGAWMCDKIGCKVYAHGGTADINTRCATKSFFAQTVSPKDNGGKC